MLFARSSVAQVDTSVEQSDAEIEKQLVLRALDRGPVFTLLGDIKPMSTDPGLFIKKEIEKEPKAC
jgi:hypothetical protein